MNMLLKGARKLFWGDVMLFLLSNAVVRNIFDLGRNKFVGPFENSEEYADPDFESCEDYATPPTMTK